MKEKYDSLDLDIIEFEGEDIITDSLPPVDDNWGPSQKATALCPARRAFLFSLTCLLLKNSLGSLFIARDLLKYV